MKKKIYYFSDGLGGIVVARSLNQAIKIIAGASTNNNKDRAELIREIKKDFKSNNINTNWTIEWYPSNAKTGFKGWSD